MSRLEKGQGFIEIAIVLAIVLLLLLAALTFFAPTISCACIYSNIVPNL
jgi:hypothetical protein